MNGLAVKLHGPGTKAAAGAAIWHLFQAAQCAQHKQTRLAEDLA